MQKIAGVVILYNPEVTVTENINSYLNQIDHLYIVNNSEQLLNQIITDFIVLDKIRFIDNKENMGVAYALNQAANQAIKDGFEFLLTMDQDSRIVGNYFEPMLNELEKDRSIGVISPFIVHSKNPKPTISSDCIDITVAMTSGCILRLSLFKKIGGFSEKLFVDYVDHEYCLRMLSDGYKVKQLNSVSLIHNLGDIKINRFFFKKVFPTNHSPLRLYYRTRNRLFVYKKYKNKFPSYVNYDKKIFFKELIKIILYEKNKFRKIYMIVLGYLNYRSNRYGKLN
jgi:rhamnosyltransferase